MVSLDYYTRVGFAIELLARSTYHKQYAMGTYMRVNMFPALWANQAHFYYSDDGSPVAIVTWAWLSDCVEKDVHATGRNIRHNEWNCGKNLFFNDWISPYNNVREVVHDMTHNQFPNEIGTSIRRRQDGSVRRINRWTGVNIRNGRRVKT